jgi:predicted nucleotidyltransferase
MTNAADELGSTMRAVADWSRGTKGLRFYVYGSRVRGDHRQDSDVDVYVRITTGVSDATVEWWTEQNRADFAELKQALPGRLELLDGPDSLKQAIIASPPYRVMGDVIAVWLPPKTVGVFAA